METPNSRSLPASEFPDRWAQPSSLLHPIFGHTRHRSASVPALSFGFLGFVPSRDVLIQRVPNICLCLSPPPSLLSSSTQTMFRGIIPGKRVPSVDLTSERNGASKENVECSAAPTRSTRKASVFQDVNGNKTQKPTTTKKQSGADSQEMVEAFDKLLVSSLLACLLFALITT